MTIRFKSRRLQRFDCICAAPSAVTELDDELLDEPLLCHWMEDRRLEPISIDALLDVLHALLDAPVDANSAHALIDGVLF